MARIDSAPGLGQRGRSVFASIALPFMFNPDLGPAAALLAMAGALARIFSGCLLLALWGGFGAWVWSAIPSHFWRTVALGPLVIGFPVALVALFWSIGAIESKFRRKR